MTNKEYERLKLEAKAEYQRTLDAIELVWSLQQSGPRAKRGYTCTPVLEVVTSTLQSLPTEFTSREVLDEIRRTDPERAARIKVPTLAGVLKRLAEEKKIELVWLGRGHAPSKYRKVKPTVQKK